MKQAFEFIPILARSKKPRIRGVTMVLDKGLGMNQAEDLMEAAPYIDIIKLGWGTSRLFSEKLIRAKVALYKSHDIAVGTGGTLFEIAYSRGATEQFFNHTWELGFNLIEISNGSIMLSYADKTAAIRQARTRGFTVISEVGKKDPREDHKLTVAQRVEEAQHDLQAGAFQVIIEARESGKDLGIYDDKGGVKEEMTQDLVRALGIENIMFEAPEKSQQAYLILHFGIEVNLGNIRSDDVIPLETLRRGIRGDTFGKV